MTTGEKIKFLRKKLGMNAETLAKKCNCSASSIYRYEKGAVEDFGHEILISLADALHTTPAYLLGATEEERPELVNGDPELTEYLEYLRDRADLRMLFSVSKDASTADVKRAVKYIESLKDIY